MDEDRFDRMEKKLDVIAEKAEDVRVSVAKIDVTLSAQHDQLVTHIKRTELLEKAIMPLQKDNNMVHGVLKFIGLIALIAGIGESVIVILSKFIH